MQQQATTGVQFCTFHLGDLLMGVDVQCVQEVIRYQEMTTVPLAHNSIGGLINLRGQIVTAIDLREQLGLTARDDGLPPMNVVVRTEEGGASLLVDEIGDVIEVSDEVFEAPPETIRGATRRLISGVIKLEGRLMLVIDPVMAIQIHDGAAEPREASH